jgi:hypothetical protein
VHRLSSFIILKTSSEAPAMGGAIEFEKRLGRALCLKMSIMHFLPVAYPPVPPPRAFPKVDVMISIAPSGIEKYSGVPLPVLPMTPDAWHSSTNV